MIGQELINLSILFFFAVIGGIIANRFKQPAVIGLLVVGAFIGPNSLNLVKDTDMMGTIVEFGAILLLFVIGLEFALPKFVKFGFKAMMIGVLKIGIISFFTYELSLLIGLGQKVALIFGILLSLSSTVAIIRILQSKGLFRDRSEVPLLIAILLIEDIFAVLVLTFLSTAKLNPSFLAIFEKLAIAITILSIAYFVMIKISKVAISWFIRNSDDEAITFIALGICVGFSYLAYYLGLSPSIGAFLAGSIVASLPDVRLFEHAIKPYSLTFSSLFFISIGTMVNFTSLKDNILLLVFFVFIVMLLRFVAMVPLTHLLGNFKKEQAVFSSIALISVSEFSLLIAQSAMNLSLGIDFVSLTAFIIFFTTITMSLCISYSDKITDALDKTSSKKWATKPKTLSNYIQLFFDELDIENADTMKFKKSFFKLLMQCLFVLFVVLGWRKLYVLLTAFEAPKWSMYSLHILSACIAAYLLYRLYAIGKIVYKTTIIILANVDSLRSTRMSTYILNNLLITMSLILIILLSPLIIVLASLPAWANVLPFAIMVAAIYRLNKVFTVLHHMHANYELPKLRKIDGLYIKPKSDGK